MVQTSLKSLLESNTMEGAAALTFEEQNHAVRCVACGHRCLIRPGKAGICRVRFNEAGHLRVPAGYVAGLQIDPIEKKPFFHAYPGNNALSFGMLGCDLHCSYCQNWVTSQALRDDEAVVMPRFVTAEHLVSIALEHGIPVMVSTYNEPLITADWAKEVFQRAHKHGIVCGFVSNGNATPEVLEFLRPCVALYKVDLKSFRDKAYRSLGCTLQNVLDSIHRLKKSGFWVELVTLIIPGFNDSAEELREMAEFIADVDCNIPWHITAFHPDYKMTGPPRTSVESLLHAYDLGREAGLHYVYPGNLPGLVGDRENTYCPTCKTTLIERQGFFVKRNILKDGRCPGCDIEIPGVWQANAPASSLGDGLPRTVHW